MTHVAPETELREITCPHCGKQFTGRLLTGPSARHNGFKCTHCRLFIPLERVEAPSGDGSP